MIGESIEQVIERRVNQLLNSESIEFWLEATTSGIEYLATDNLGEIVEKLVILHIRTWMLEDQIQLATTDKEVAEIKRKLDICFKIKRPNLVQALNRMVDTAIVDSKSLVEDSVKLYKGIDNDKK